MSATITATTQPSSARDQQLDDLLTRQREARKRLEYLRSQIGPARRDVAAAGWAVQGYKNRLQPVQQQAGGAR